MRHDDRRVVITGLGLVTPVGNDLATNWEQLLAGRSGIRAIGRFDAAQLPVRIAGEVRNFEPLLYVEKRDVKKMDAFTLYAMAATHMALADARLEIDVSVADRVGVIVGVGMGGITTLEEGHQLFLEGGARKLSPFMVPRLIVNMAPGQIAIRFGAKGVNYVVASACASGGHAVGEACRLIRFGFQDAMLAGGAEATVTPLSIAGFAAMRALSTRNEEPARACRPFDRERDGFVMSEGAGMLVLEERQAALSRGARIYAEIVGYGANADAYHITTPAPEGAGAARCMRLALDDGNLQPEEVDYINAHGTSTPYNDANETQAVKQVFGEHAKRLAISSTKSMTGHLLGAAGAVEVAYTALTAYHGIVPPTINYEYPDPECDLDYVPNQARRMPVRVALSNSFGFGGTNACLALRRHED
jgi:3-oxoacyl-[acyl-carrier-protein] synthase II